MAGSEGWGRIVYRKDERGVILDSQVVPAGEETPEGFEDKAEYQTVVISPTEGRPVDESRLTLTKNAVDLRQTVDVIKGDEQEGPSDPGAQSDGDYEITTEDESDAGQTIDEVKDEADEQEGPSDPGSDSDDGEGPPPQSGPGSGKAVWEQYAAKQDVSVPEDATRDDIIAAVKKAGKPV